ncbi:MAG: hypothetical protein KA714_23075 [Limnoraphis sp. WC205]|nr:hypothetical protein [Limnoraphis sp. WC205]
MRWIDIDQLEIPDGWQAKADKALNELRQEIERAEQEACLTGKDISVARKKAISEGLDKNSRKKIWRDLAPYLARLHNGKCWYSESLNPGSNKDVDHFRPKNRVNEDPDHEGYWWLAFDWRNYRYSCQWCNQRRVDTANNTNGGKWDRFPVFGTFRARQEEDNFEMEEVDLLDPIDPEDWKLLTFRPDGQPTPASINTDTREYKRAEISIQVYHLHCQEFVRDRKKLATNIRLLIERMEIYYSKITDSTMRTLFKNSQKELFRLIDRDSEYSAAALAYARSEVYKMERGHQVKREWLEKILNSNP